MSAYYLTPKAAEGIESIWDYIAGDSGVRRADKVVDDIFKAIESLAEMPGMGHGREDLADETLLAWPVHSYLVVYRDRRHRNPGFEMEATSCGVTVVRLAPAAVGTTEMRPPEAHG